MALKKLRRLCIWGKKTVANELNGYEDTNSLQNSFSWIMLREAGLQGNKKWLNDKEVEVVNINFYQKIGDEKVNIGVSLRMDWLFQYLGHSWHSLLHDNTPNGYM